MALADDALLVGAPCTTVEDELEGAAYLYSMRTDRLLARFPGRNANGRFGSTVALLPAAVAIGGRGPDAADAGVVVIPPRPDVAGAASPARRDRRPPA